MKRAMMLKKKFTKKDFNQKKNKGIDFKNYSRISKKNNYFNQLKDIIDWKKRHYFRNLSKIVTEQKHQILTENSFVNEYKNSLSKFLNISKKLRNTSVINVESSINFQLSFSKVLKNKLFRINNKYGYFYCKKSPFLNAKYQETTSQKYDSLNLKKHYLYNKKY